MSEQKLGRSAIFLATIAAVLSLVVVTVFNGRSGFLGGSLASITVIIFFSVQLLVARISRDLDPTLTMLLAMISYFAKVILMGVFLVLIGRFTDRSTVDRTSFAISALVITMIWLATEIRSFTKIRFQMPFPKGTSDEKE
jgi:ATP synthase protein I